MKHYIQPRSNFHTLTTEVQLLVSSADKVINVQSEAAQLAKPADTHMQSELPKEKSIWDD